MDPAPPSTQYLSLFERAIRRGMKKALNAAFRFSCEGLRASDPVPWCLDQRQQVYTKQSNSSSYMLLCRTVQRTKSVGLDRTSALSATGLCSATAAKQRWRSLHSLSNSGHLQAYYKRSPAALHTAAMATEGSGVSSCGSPAVCIYHYPCSDGKAFNMYNFVKFTTF